MFEADGVLTTFALDTLPADLREVFGNDFASFAASNEVTADKLPDHRLAYLEYEGPVSGDRGTVRRLDRGEYTAMTQSTFRIIGQKLQGEIKLVAPSSNTDNLWRLSYSPVRPAK
jgi:hypothetical protein